MLLGLGRHTLAGSLATQGRQHLDWSADYRAFSAGRLDPDVLFGAVLREALASRPAGRTWFALDDSTLGKSGRKIPRTGWRRDPLSPPFAVNFQWGHRVQQLSLLLPEASGGATGLPLAFDLLPNRPSAKEQAGLPPGDLREALRQANVNTAAVDQCRRIAAQTAGPAAAAVDGRFANRSFLRRLPDGWSAVARIRKDAALFHPPEGEGKGRPRIYGKPAPRPEELRQDESHPWRTVPVHAAGQPREMRVKELGPLRSRITGRADGRLVVIAPAGYRLVNGGKLLYRQPAYLWITDPAMDVAEAVQGYVWRWEIEVNFRDQKTLLGVGQAQVRLPESVLRVPAWQVASYSALLWSARSLGQDTQAVSLPRPKWHPAPQSPGRPSTARLVSQLRHDAWAAAIRPEAFHGFSSPPPQNQNPSKPAAQLDSSLPAALFLSHL